MGERQEGRESAALYKETLQVDNSHQVKKSHIIYIEYIHYIFLYNTHTHTHTANAKNVITYS